ncbi:hypothetical protein AFE_2538 [Acidithiobacillus ferrooxidans ATCC 23270]|uniref:Uncharacterized protein n=1 Tax=Acidithiobacillus ferrooxidans (strain ATCC 23270 / DSM 14882 / CIP 104768 / NCIMB 8455) TaxID=243159 RepID=B7J772_ACIF2|nr:hypothetical protein AFE_2538 [Acidithiobacillus ferrooxidans ATCC 23270]
MVCCAVSAYFGVGFGAEHQVAAFALTVNADAQGGDTDAGVLEGDFVGENTGQFDAGFLHGLAFADDADLCRSLAFEHGLNPERMTGDAAINLRIAVGIVLQVVEFDHFDQIRTHGSPFLITL